MRKDPTAFHDKFTAWKKQPLLVRVGLQISLIGRMLHDDGFKAVIRHIFYNFVISIFKFGYKHSKRFRKRILKKLKASGASPLFILSMIYFLTHDSLDFEKIISEEYIEQYIKLSELQEEDVEALRKDIAEFKDNIKHTDDVYRRRAG